ncbi:GNAT family protein [Phytohabitans sp. ZYX-F-186]|uniref:GNAT family protein n=1 Tax=Phytohabitans maris TaxID=3071409 RepID=A0ABU0ZML6_9ACTN|nr:GNAT family protein [Phytohabitans sp. ZYX-F-186]MDQ7908198.1 GNAT family protein [Phytohabitans sp. ZYX-F-186]
MFRPSYPIHTRRLTLRPFTMGDLDPVWGYQRLPEVAEHMLWDPRDLVRVKVALERMVKEDRLAAEGDCLSLAVVDRERGVLVGQVELVWLSDRHRQGEIGYVLDPRHQGAGFATEAAREVLRLGFEGLRLHRIVGRCSAANTPSAALLERLGMRREAHFRQSALVKNAWRDELVYAMLREDWLQSL